MIQRLRSFGCFGSTGLRYLTLAVAVHFCLGCAAKKSPSTSESTETTTSKQTPAGADALARLAPNAHRPFAEKPEEFSPGLSPSENATPHRFQFQECGAERGLEFTYRNGEENQQFAVIENLGGGVGLFDFDHNGWPDVVIAGGGAVHADKSITGNPFGLFINREGRFVEVTKSADFQPALRFSHGLCVWDFNNDGFDDVFTTGFDGASLLVNLGDGTFHEVNGETFNPLRGIGTSAASGDFNADGIPDIYIVTYVDWSFDNHPVCSAASGSQRELCSPKDFSGTADYLFFGRGDGTFENVNEAAGLKDDGKGLGVLAVDVDRDGDLDIYVANDTTNNFLYLNDGSGVFDEAGLLNGVALDERALPNGSMGLTACDVNHDLALDLWVANYERESFAIYRNEGNGFFLHASRRYGISALGGLYVGFGTDWEDFDHDGLEEIVITNGHVLRFPTGAPRRQRPLLLARQGDRFSAETFPESSYFAGDYEGRGLAVGDVDCDGKSDIVITHLNEPVVLLRNQSREQGRCLRVELTGTKSTRNAEGAILELETSAGKRLQTIVGGGSYLSQNQRMATFGVPFDQQTLGLTIFWPSGIVQTATVPHDATYMHVVEP